MQLGLKLGYNEFEVNFAFSNGSNAVSISIQTNPLSSDLPMWSGLVNSNEYTRPYKITTNHVG